MEIKDFKPKWAISKSRRRPTSASKSKLLVAYDYFMKTVPVLGGPATYYIHPKMCTKEFCALPELGEVAQSHRFLERDVTLDHYPAMSDPRGHARLEPEDIGDYIGMSFLGAEFLVLTGFKSGFQFQLWDWKEEKMVHSLFTPQFPSEVDERCLDLRVHPLRWYQAAAQTNFRVIVLEIKTSKDRFYLGMNYYFIEEDEGEPVLRKAREGKDSLMSRSPQSDPRLTIQSFCWLPENNVIIATSHGVFKAGLGDLTLLKLGNLEAKAASMVWKSQTLYVAYEAGLIEVVQIGHDNWDVKNVVSVGNPLAHACLSPDSKYLTATTRDNNVINLEVDCGGLKLVSKVSDPDFGEIVGVGFLGPVLSHCVVAEKSGALHVIDETNGDLVSTIRIEEEVSSMASSPLCSCVILGSSTGYLYFVDCTVLAKPRIVLLEKTYDVPICWVEFDNFGQFAVTSAENRVVKIWGAVPSSGFEMLGSMKMTSPVRDVAAFSRNGDEGTYVFVLTENDSENGVLTRITLPKDFRSTFGYYHKDNFGTLRLRPHESFFTRSR